ncbi:hypothetical protein GPALN_006652 [Globodera pallida]|nr:hypothetical protein GPALN_006652 [Globodera pallida]
MKLIISCFAFLFFAVSLSFACGDGSSDSPRVRTRTDQGTFLELNMKVSMNAHNSFCKDFEEAECKKAQKGKWRCKWFENSCHGTL